MFRELLGEEGGSRKSGKRAAEREEELEYRRTQVMLETFDEIQLNCVPHQPIRAHYPRI